MKRDNFKSCLLNAAKLSSVTPEPLSETSIKSMP